MNKAICTIIIVTLASFGIQANSPLNEDPQPPEKPAHLEVKHGAIVIPNIPNNAESREEIFKNLREITKVDVYKVDLSTENQEVSFTALEVGETEILKLQRSDWMFAVTMFTYTASTSAVIWLYQQPQDAWTAAALISVFSLPAFYSTLGLKALDNYFKKMSLVFGTKELSGHREFLFRLGYNYIHAEAIRGAVAGLTDSAKFFGTGQIEILFHVLANGGGQSLADVSRNRYFTHKEAQWGNFYLFLAGQPFVLMDLAGVHLATLYEGPVNIHLSTVLVFGIKAALAALPTIKPVRRWLRNFFNKHVEWSEQLNHRVDNFCRSVFS